MENRVIIEDEKLYTFIGNLISKRKLHNKNNFSTLRHEEPDLFTFTRPSNTNRKEI